MTAKLIQNKKPELVLSKYYNYYFNRDTVIKNLKTLGKTLTHKSLVVNNKK